MKIVLHKIAWAAFALCVASLTVWLLWPREYSRPTPPLPQSSQSSEVLPSSEVSSEPIGASSKLHQHNETWYTERIAAKYGWRSEVATRVGTRCDLVTPDLAVEVEWPSRKVFESVGQSLHYGIELDKRPAVLLLVSGSPSEAMWIGVLDGVAAKHGIEVMQFDTGTMELKP